MPKPMSAPPAHQVRETGINIDQGEPDRSAPGARLGVEPRVLSGIRTAVLHDLTQPERLLLILWYAERMTPLEISAVLDMTRTQVQHMHDRVVDKLRALARRGAA